MAEKGQTVRVLYDYDYTDSKGNKVSIRAGEECTLLKKSTEEWWSVLRKSERKPIYVPANYVDVLPDKSKEAPKTAMKPKKKGPPPPTKPKFPRQSIEDEALKMLDAALEGEMFDDLDAEIPNDAGLTMLPPSHAAEKPNIKPDHNDNEDPALYDIPIPVVGGDSGDEDIDIPAPDYDDDSPPTRKKEDVALHSMGSTGDSAIGSQDSLDKDVQGPPEDNHQDDLPDYANVQDVKHITNASDTQPDYMNLQDIQAVIHGGPIPGPIPGPASGPAISPTGISSAPGTRSSVAIATATTLVTDLDDDWEMRKDNKTGNVFKYNRTTKEVDEDVPQETRSPGNSLERRVPEIRKISLPDMRSSGVSEPTRKTSLPIPIVQLSPLRRPDVLRVNSFGTPHTLDTSLPNSEQLSPLEEDRPPLSAGWRKAEDDAGEVFFVNGVNEEKWVPVIDGSRTYYYKKGSGETAWQLPEVHSRLGSVDSHVPEDRPNLVKNKARASWSIGDPSLLRKYPVAPPLAPSRNTAMIQEESEPVSTGNQGNFSNDVSPSGSVTSSLSRPLTEKKGFLFKTKSVENGKKIKKNWSKSFVVLQGGGLYFYPDQKSSQPSTKHPRGKFEFSIGLRGCSIDVDATREKSSRKNVMVLTTQGGVEFLLQDTSTTAAGAADWFPAVKENITSSMSISHSGSVNSLSELCEPLSAGGPSLEPQDESRHSRKPSKKVPPRPSTPDDLLTTGEKNSKFKDWINKWLKNRPSYESVQQKGYIKDGVFGSHLQTLFDRTKYLVPAFVNSCLEAIEKRGLQVDGIYRVSGNLAQIQKLRFLVDKDEHYDLLDPDWDIHVIAGALKLFFRELREPLFPFNFFDKFLAAIQLKDKKQKQKTVKELIKMMPTPNRKTLEILCLHLNRVIDNSRENRMLLQNVAIVFGPTLMWPAVESQNIAITMVYQGQCVEYIVQEYKNLF